MSNQPIRVLQIMGIMGSGGVEAVIMNYYRHIDRDKVQFDFVAHKGASEYYVNEIKSFGGSVYEVTPYSKNPIAFTSEIYHIIKEHDYQIVHSNMNALSCFPLFAAYMAGAKVRILHNHTTDTKAERLRTMIKYILRPFAKMFANQYWACSKLAGKWMYGVAAVQQGKVTIINNAIDLKKFTFDKEKRSRLRKELGVENCFVVGHVGRFMKQKNHEFLIKIFAEVAKNNEDAKLLLIGDGPLKGQIEEQVKALGLTDKVVFTGVRTDVADLYNVMDVFVLPSYYEGLPVVGVEVLANGLPFFCSENVTREILISKAVKLLSIDEGVEHWYDAVLKCEKQGRLDITGDFADKGFDIAVEAKKLEKWYLGKDEI